MKSPVSAARSIATPRRGRLPQGDTEGGQVQSLVRALSVLDVLAATHGGLALTAIAQKSNLATSTAHRLLNTLGKMGYVYQNADNGLWYVGLQSFRVGSAFLANRDFVEQSHPYMRRLMEQSGETANLAILDGIEAVFIAQVQCREMMRLLVRLGSRVPLHASGVGKAILAALPNEQIDAILRVHGLPRFTANTIIAPEALRAALATIRRRGFSFDDEEHALGVRCVAAGIYDEHAEPICAISLAGPVSRLPDERIKSLGPIVVNTAEEITTRLGGRWPHPY